MNDELILDIDNVELTAVDEEIREKVDKRDRQLKRWFMTINHPFWESDKFDEIDSTLNCEYEIKHDYYNLEYLKSFNNIDLFEFHFIKVTSKINEKKIKKSILNEDGILKEIDVEYVEKVEKTIIVERPFFKNYECLQTYISNLSVEGLKYSIGQIERGKEGTTHLQCGVIFDDKSGKRFYTMKKLFPTAYLDKVRGSNYDLKIYCTKEDTRIMEPFEIGQFSEMRARTDFAEFKSALLAGASNIELMQDFYGIVAQIGLRNIDLQRAEIMKSTYSKQCRNVEVYYIYGAPGIGKTQRVYLEYGFENVFSMAKYGQFCFHGYNFEKVLLMDEFIGQMDLTYLNKVLDVYPLRPEIKGGETIACYDKVYIISNFPLKHHYKDIQEQDPILFDKAFNRRIHNIYRVDEKGNIHKERETIFEDIPEEQVKLKGWTKRIKQVVEYDTAGNPTMIYNYYKGEQMKMELVDDAEIENIF